MDNLITENEEFFIKRLTKHIRRVQDNMILLEINRDSLPFKLKKWELIRRGFLHDLTKFNKKLVYGYVLTNEYFRNKRLGKSTDHIDIELLKKYWEKHEKLEKHHPKFKEKMSNLDICEMCCDLYAMTQEFKEEDCTKYFKKVLCKNIPLVKRYSENCLIILELLHNLNNINN